MKFTKENVEKVIDDYFWQAGLESCSDLIAGVYNLDDTPEKVGVPKFVAEWIESYLSEGGTLTDMLYSLTVTCAPVADKAVRRWFKKNTELMLKALLNGCEVEKEPLYYIPLPHRETSDGIQQVLSKRKGDKNYFASRPVETLQQRYTKEELEQVPEIYKPFAKLIEEEAND